MGLKQLFHQREKNIEAFYIRAVFDGSEDPSYYIMVLFGFTKISVIFLWIMVPERKYPENEIIWMFTLVCDDPLIIFAPTDKSLWRILFANGLK